LLELLELPVEEVIAPWNDDDRLRLGSSCSQRSDLLGISHVVVLTLHEEYGFEALVQKRRAGNQINGEPERKHRLHARVVDSHAQRHHRSEGMSSHDQWETWVPFLELIERRADVLPLSSPFVVNPLTRTRAPKVETHRGKPLAHQRSGRPKHDFRLHRAAVERVGMANDARGDRLSIWNGEDRFQSTRRTCDLQRTYSRHEERLCRRAISLKRRLA